MEELLLEYGEKFWALGYRMHYEFVFNGQEWMHILNVNLKQGHVNEAGGGFREPLAMFYYMDTLLEHCKNYGYLLPGGTQLGNTTP